MDIADRFGRVGASTWRHTAMTLTTAYTQTVQQHFVTDAMASRGQRLFDVCTVDTGWTQGTIQNVLTVASI